MTGYQSKRAAAQAKMVQWANEAFNDWWNNDYDDSTNPYEKDTFAYWAWAGWQAALAQPEQDTIYRLSALIRAQQITIDKLEAQPEQEPMAQVTSETGAKQGEEHMTDEDWEFNRIEMEARVRMMAVRYAMEQAKEPSPIPFLTAEQWAELNAEKE